MKSLLVCLQPVKYSVEIWLLCPAQLNRAMQNNLQARKQTSHLRVNTAFYRTITTDTISSVSCVCHMGLDDAHGFLFP